MIWRPSPPWPGLLPCPALPWPCPLLAALGPGPGFCAFADVSEFASNSQDSDLGRTRFELGRVSGCECVRNRLYGIKYTENIKQIRHTTSEPLPCGPATTYLKDLTVLFVHVDIAYYDRP